MASVQARRAKIAEISALLAAVPPGEVPVAVAFLSGELRQRQIGVGYAALGGPFQPAAAPASPLPPGSAPPGSAPPGSAPPGSGPAGSGPADPADRTGPAAAPALTLTDTDAAFAAIGAVTGQGAQAERRRLLAALLNRATDSERAFLIRLLAGDLRQGALEGVMTEAIARAAGVPADPRQASALP